MQAKKNIHDGRLKFYNNIYELGEVYFTSEWVDATQQEIDASRLAELKTNYKNAIDAEREFLLNNGLVTIQTQSNVNWVAKIDPNTSNIISNYESSRETSFVFGNINPKNTDVILTKTDLLAYLNAVKVYHTIPNPKHLYSIARGLRTQIDACTTLAALEALIFPPTPTEFIDKLTKYRVELQITDKFDYNAWYNIFEVGKKPDWWSMLRGNV